MDQAGNVLAHLPDNHIAKFMPVKVGGFNAANGVWMNFGKFTFITVRALSPVYDIPDNILGIAFGSKKSIGSSRPWRCEAITGKPKIAASIAPATVPEYRISSATFIPWLIPVKTRSGRQSIILLIPKIIQSLGVPEQLWDWGQPFQSQHHGVSDRPRRAGPVVGRRNHPYIIAEPRGKVPQKAYAKRIDPIIIAYQNSPNRLASKGCHYD